MIRKKTIRNKAIFGFILVTGICINMCFAATRIEAFSKNDDFTSKYSTVVSKKAYDGIAAFVNGEAIIIHDVMVAVPNVMRSLYKNDPEARKLSETELLIKAYKICLDNAIDHKLIVAEYWKGDQRISEHALDRLVSETIDQRFGGDLSEMQDALSEMRMTYKEWKSNMEESLIVRSMRQTFVTSNAHVSPSEIIATYKNRKDEFSTPETTHVFMISLTADTEDDIKTVAANVKQRLDSGESFEDVARDVSKDNYAKVGGDRGLLVPDEEFREEIVEALASTNIGAVSQPVFVGTRAYIVKKNKVIPASVPQLKDVQGDIERVLREEEAERIYNSWVKRFRESAVITVFDPF